jgi:NAD(P)-dependent dehydrogenase (short-subunit alcohol dehydrogenase family)
VNRVDFFDRTFGLDGRVAFVTGARQGIGEALAVGLARAGASVAVTSRDASRLSGLVARLEELGAKALALELDVSDVTQVDAAIAATVETFGGLDIAINNAAATAHCPALDLTVEEWDTILETNLRGAFLVARAAARAMSGRGGGRIVSISSPFARIGLADRVAYSASKAGLEQLTRSLAVEWARDNITVNTVAPTTVLTESRRALFSDEEVLRKRVEQIPLGRLAREEDVVGAVLFLCAEAGSFVTGENILVDGGYTINRS